MNLMVSFLVIMVFLFFLRILRIIQILFPICHLAPPSLVISSVVERSPSVAVKISPCATLSRDDIGALGEGWGARPQAPVVNRRLRRRHRRHRRCYHLGCHLRWCCHPDLGSDYRQYCRSGWGRSMLTAPTCTLLLLWQ